MAGDWDRYRDHVKAFLSRNFPTVSEEDLEDLTQTVCYRTARACKEPIPSNWTFRVARNAALDLFRKPYRRRRCVEYDAVARELSVTFTVNPSASAPEPFGDYIMTTSDTCETDVRMLMENLPEHYRAALTDHLLGYTAAERAVFGGCSEAAAKGRLHRACKSMRKIYEEGQDQ